VLICTDADSDGMQIRCLIIGFIYKLMPSLLKEGKIFIAETPLYEISHGGNTYFAYDEMEKENICNQLSGKLKVQRSKGLGENEPQMMWESTMKPGSRRLIKIEYSKDIEEMEKLMEAILGKDIESRKKLISSLGEQYLKVI